MAAFALSSHRFEVGEGDVPHKLATTDTSDAADTDMLSDIPEVLWTNSCFCGVSGLHKQIRVLRIFVQTLCMSVCGLIFVFKKI